MSVEQATNLILGILAGLAAVLSALASVIAALKIQAEVREVGKGMNGRLDQLLQEREARIRAEQATEMEKSRIASLQPLTGTQRPTIFMEDQPPPGPRK